MGPETVVRWLGAPRFRAREVGGRTRRAGVALGLAATPEGGDVLVVEAARLPGVGRLRVTGTVGPMVTESANVALTWVRSNADRLAGLGPGLNDATDVHVHLCEAARSKDGPSAGVALAAAVVSALTGQPVRGDAAMTGELTLSGTVEPVGGIRQKVLAACRAGMAEAVLPAANAADVAECFGRELPGGIRVRYARTMDDVLEVVLPDVFDVARIEGVGTDPPPPRRQARPPRVPVAGRDLAGRAGPAAPAPEVDEPARAPETRRLPRPTRLGWKTTAT